MPRTTEQAWAKHGPGTICSPLKHFFYPALPNLKRTYSESVNHKAAAFHQFSQCFQSDFNEELNTGGGFTPSHPTHWGPGVQTNLHTRGTRSGWGTRCSACPRLVSAHLLHLLLHLLAPRPHSEPQVGHRQLQLSVDGVHLHQLGLQLPGEGGQMQNARLSMDSTAEPSASHH